MALYAAQFFLPADEQMESLGYYNGDVFAPGQPDEPDDDNLNDTGGRYVLETDLYLNTAAAPRCRASAMCARPSYLPPGTARNRSPARTLRLSRDRKSVV